MPRSAVTFALVLSVAAFGVAAPVPKENDIARMRRIYGTPEDPGGSRFEMDGEKLRVFVGLPDMQGRRHIAPEKDMKPAGASFVWRDVEGDFTISTRVVFAGDPKQKTGDRMAGLIVWHNSENHAILFRHGNRGERLDMRISRPNNWSDTMEFFHRPPTELFLRLRHEENRGEKYLTAQYSQDGETWIHLSAGYAPWDKIKVGVFVKNKSETGSETIFDEYNFTRPKK